jgi:hypothetical protein
MGPDKISRSAAYQKEMFIFIFSGSLRKFSLRSFFQPSLVKAIFQVVANQISQVA